MIESLAWWVTHYGDYQSLLAVTAAYALVVRRGEFRPFVMTYCAIYAVTWLKEAFALPRPPGAAVGGFAFPSGHAAVSLAAFVSIAVIEDGDSLGPRTKVAAAVAGTIGVSRVVIGVHYPRDVLAGFALGAAIVWVGFAAAGALRGPVSKGVRYAVS